MTVRMGDKEAWCDAYVKPKEAVPERARFHPEDKDADWTTCHLTAATIYRGFCSNLTCGKRAWQISMYRNVEHGRLCDSCLKAASP